MSFGKRGQSTPDTEYRRTHTQTGMRSASTWSGIGAIELVIVPLTILASFCGVYFLLGGISGRSAPTTPAPLASFASDPTPVARSYNKEGPVPFLMGADWKMTLDMQQTADGFDAIDSELHERCMKPTSKAAAGFAEKRGRTFLTPEQGAEFLACSMNIYRSRLCEERYRKRLVARLNEFVRARRKHLAVVKDVRNSDMGRMIVEVDKAGKKDSDITAGYRPAAFVPESLAEQVHALSKAGFITQEDFGGLFSAAPDELKPYLLAEGNPACG